MQRHGDGKQRQQPQQSVSLRNIVYRDPDGSQVHDEHDEPDQRRRGDHDLGCPGEEQEYAAVIQLCEQRIDAAPNHLPLQHPVDATDEA